MVVGRGVVWGGVTTGGGFAAERWARWRLGCPTGLLYALQTPASTACIVHPKPWEFLEIIAPL